MAADSPKAKRHRRTKRRLSLTQRALKNSLKHRAILQTQVQQLMGIIDKARQPETPHEGEQ